MEWKNLCYRLLMLILILLSFQLGAQNIIPNGSFENLIDCPNNGGEIFWAPPWASSSASPDLFNLCGELGYSVSQNRVGFQNPHSGDGYAGIATYFETIADTREFAQCKINYALQNGEQYYIEFYASQSDSCQFASHNLGVTFTQVDTTTFLPCYLSCDIYVENDASNPLTSKLEWSKVSGTFTALGGERYLHLGNFRTDYNSEIEFVGGSSNPNVMWNQAYYYIDDVWLSHIDSMHYVGINDELEIKNDELSLYPNPNAGVFNIDLVDLNGVPAELLLYDLTGKQVAHRRLDHTHNTIQLEATDGLYLYTVTVNGTLKWSGKIAVATD